MSLLSVSLAYGRRDFSAGQVLKALEVLSRFLSVARAL
jgi:hypothetical protein